jgi:hypothetical protein
MTIDASEKTILRSLAQQLADMAVDPVMNERREQWVAHNSLRSTRPLLLVYPEGSWQELIPADTLQCSSREVRWIEMNLRQKIYTREHFHDDSVIEPEWIVPAVISNTGWGLEQRVQSSSVARGAYSWESVLNDTSDLQKMHFPELVYDEGKTMENLEMLEDLFDDILPVMLKGCTHISYHLTAQFIKLRGVTEMFMDMMDRPEFVHEVMAFFEEGHRRELLQLIDMDLLSLNNNGTYQNSGGNGYTDELPMEGYDAANVRPCDMWASAEAQEMASVSPEMHEEFALQYEKRLLEPFGLTGYGCCEDLTDKMDYVLTIPNIRRISCSPWADVERCAEKLKGNYIFSWKPNPAHLVGTFDAEAVRDYIGHTLDVCRQHDCVLEIVLKDTHTVENQPERFDEWTQIARDLINQ